VHTKYCPHCGSVKIHRVYEESSLPLYDLVTGELVYPSHSHYHECEDCNETWDHHEVK
jgi:hypothetical protein